MNQEQEVMKQMLVDEKKMTINKNKTNNKSNAHL